MHQPFASLYRVVANRCILPPTYYHLSTHASTAQTFTHPTLTLTPPPTLTLTPTSPPHTHAHLWDTIGHDIVQTKYVVV